MRKLNKKASDQPGWISVGLILAIAVLALGLFFLLGPGKALLAKWRGLTGGPGDSLANLVTACDANCATNNNVVFCSLQAVSGVPLTSAGKLMTVGKYPNDFDSVVGTKLEAVLKTWNDAKDALKAAPDDATKQTAVTNALSALNTERAKYTTAYTAAKKSADLVDFKDITCKDLENAGLAQACSSITC